MNLSGANTNKGGNFELRKRMGEHWPELELRLYYERRYRRHIYEILLIPFFLLTNANIRREEGGKEENEEKQTKQKKKKKMLEP